MNTVAIWVEGAAALLAVCGMAYGLIALWAARAFERDVKRARRLVSEPEQWPGVTVLKPMKGVDARMYAGLVSHCRLSYPGEVELLFGVSSLDDPAVAEIARLRVEYPKADIRLVECPEVLGANGKVSNLAQMAPQARHEYLVVNDSDIRVAPEYLQRVMTPFAFSSDDKRVGLVTLPYVGRALGGLWSKLESLGIATEFMAGVLTARKLEGGVKFGLGSTLATTKSALAAIGGFESLVDELADDYELGARLSAAGYRVELIAEVVETSVPAYSLRGFCEHQLRWSRGVRDSRKAGYLGLGVTYMVPWSLMAVIASAGSLWSVSLLSLALLVRYAVALTVGVGVLNDVQVVRFAWLLPLRDCFALFFWVWSYASDEVVWRGQRFRLKDGRLEPVQM
ncbi:glycosyltransferase [Granulicella sp. 5B5]|nr:glycosyltransferase [Granulicella sp. 5B5]